MDVEPQAVTRAVPERLSQPVRNEHQSRGPIDLGRRRSRLDGIDCRRLRVPDRSMKPDGVW
jgi:hypothetical protein